MQSIVGAREANQHFSQLLRRVQGGERIIVTSHGRPVAEVSGINGVSHERWEARKSHFINRLRQNGATPLVAWSRNELYD